MENVNSIIKLQSVVRGMIVRDKLRSLKDGMNLDILEKCIDVYNDTIRSENNINKSLKNKKIRLSNFPSHISENIAKFAIFKKYNIMPSWDTDKGDLVLSLNDLHTIRMEVKGSVNLSNGPPTFGPTENWDYIYFVDGVNTFDKKYKVYEIKLSNTSELWKNLMVNKNQTFQDQCREKRRPRLTFRDLQNQLQNHCKLIFNGNISDFN